MAVQNNIVAVKESTRDVTNVSRMINRFGDRFKILCGVDTLAMEELVMGSIKFNAYDLGGHEQGKF